MGFGNHIQQGCEENKLDSSNQGSFFEVDYVCRVSFVKGGVLWLPGKFQVYSVLSSNGVYRVYVVDFSNFDVCSIQCTTQPVLLGSAYPFI